MIPKRVVIVDDTMSIGRFLQAALLTLDKTLSISVVPSAEEALLEAGHYAVDLIITDINLPGISGVEMARKVHARFPEVKVILISGMSDIPIAEYAREVDAVAYFLKPLDTAQFLETARACLGLSAVESVAAAETPPRLPDALASLYKKLDAISVILLDERGRVAAQAGDPPEAGFEERWAPSILAAASSSEKVARLLGEPSAGNVLVLRGTQFNLLISPVGVLTLIVILKAGEQLVKPQSIGATLDIQQELADLLKDMGLKIETAAPLIPVGEAMSAASSAAVQEAAEEPVTAEFAALFDTPQKDLRPEAAENFWETAAASAEATTSSADVLSFEQAKKLGLVEE